MRSKLRAPLRDVLESSLDEARVQRMWRGVSRGPTRRERARWLLTGALVMCALAFIGGLRVRDAGPLAADGGGAPRLDLPRVVLSDGSQIDVGARAQLVLIENSGHAF